MQHTKHTPTQAFKISVLMRHAAAAVHECLASVLRVSLARHIRRTAMVCAVHAHKYHTLCVSWSSIRTEYGNVVRMLNRELAKYDNWPQWWLALVAISRCCDVQVFLVTRSWMTSFLLTSTDSIYSSISPVVGFYWLLQHRYNHQQLTSWSCWREHMMVMVAGGGVGEYTQWLAHKTTYVRCLTFFQKILCYAQRFLYNAQVFIWC